MKNSLSSSVWKIAVVVLLTFWITTTAAAQNIQFTQGSVSSGLDNTIQIPIVGHPGRGASLPLNLYYSSRVWRLGHLATVNDMSNYTTITEAIYAENSTSGWKTSLDLPIIEWPKEEDQYYYTGKQFCFVCNSGFRRFRIPRVYITMPDGSKHELRRSDQPYEGPLQVTGTFYAVDGSRLRYDSSGQNSGILYMPDGSRYELFQLDSVTARFIDRNGNMLIYNKNDRAWKDTLGRTIAMPFPAAPQAGVPYQYVPQGMRPDKPFIFRWQNLSDAGVITNGAAPKPVASHYLPTPSATPSNYLGNNYPQGWQNSLFTSDSGDEEYLTYVVQDYVPGQPYGTQAFNPVVLTEIELPNGLKYKFSYNIYGEIDKISYPTGAYDQYAFDDAPPIGDVKPPYAQMNRVVTQRQLSAKGDGSDLATWSYSVFGSPGLPRQTISTTAPDGTYSETLKHNFMAPLQSGQGNPHFWPFGWEDARQGMVYEERTYDKPPSQGGVMLRRSLTDYVWDDQSVPPRIGLQGEQWVHAFRNARPTKNLSLILDTGGNALAKLITYGYNSNPAYTFTTGLDRTHMAETHFASVPQTSAQNDNVNTISTSYTFPAASSSVTTYLDDSNYRIRHILGLATSVVLKDFEGEPVSKSETFYDEIGMFPLIPYSDLANDEGYNDPGSGTVRGNATTTRRYIDVNAGTYLETHAQFDQCGNIVNAWNERATAPFNEQNASARNEYSAASRHAYLTQTITAVPDPTGAHGSTTAFTSRSTFDYTTGLVQTTTDVNDQVTNFSYTDDQGQQDVMNRLRKITRPDGSWTKFSFGETLGNFFMLTETQQDAARTLRAYQYADPMGRASRNFTSEGGSNYIATDTIYDQMGRVWKVSNPYRTTTLNGVAHTTNTDDWTVTHYDAMSRVDYVTLPDASQVVTSYQGIYTTITDQAGRQRRQKIDALGRIVRVDEANLSGDIGTNPDAPTQPTYYDYNTQGNLIHITQGTGSGTIQHRYFKYDALGRLMYERQVEQAGTHSAYDPLTENSAWSRKLVYDETIGGVSYKGLLTSAHDALNIRTEFRYDNLTRIYQVSYSDGTPTVSNYYDSVRFSVPEDARPVHNRGKLVEAQTAAVGTLPATSQASNYDLMGRAIQSRQTVETNAYTMRYGYNLAGALTSETYPSGRVVSYAFDDAARMSTISSGSTTYANQFDYSTTPGLLKQLTLGNGAVESFSYNSRLQVKSINLTKSGAQLQHYDYKYGVYNPDNNTLDESKNTGQIARIEGFIATAKQWQQNFAYDSLGRLKSAREFRGDNPTPSGQVWLTNYEYDVFGNRFQKQAQNAQNPFTPIWTEDADINKNTNRYATGLTYDDAGNVIVDSKFRNRSFQYDANNRQKQSSDGATTTVSVYDAAGQRVATQVGGVLTNVLVYDATGKLLAEYGSPSPTQGTQYAFDDQQGSPRVITNASGAVVSRHDYAPFGEEIAGNVGMRSGTPGYAEADGIRHKYAGMENNEATGMSHTLWRQYDNLSARWTTPDPYGGSMSMISPQSFNRYSYVENDPVNKIDPLGLALSDIGIVQTTDPSLARDLENDSIARLRQVTNPPAPATPHTLVHEQLHGGPETTSSEGENSTGEDQQEGDGAESASETETATVSVTESTVAAPDSASPDPQHSGKAGRQTKGERIASIAMQNEGGEEWRTSQSRTAKRNKKVKFGAGSNKCNLFVYEVLLAAGVSPPTSGGKGKWPARAEEWADTSINNLNGWEIVKGGGMQAGDVVALARWSIFSTTEASGHVAIAVSSDRTVGTGRDDGKIVRGEFGTRWHEWGVVVRRYVGKGK